MKKILIIDDDSDFVEAMKILLEANNFEINSFNDTKGGVDAVKNTKPDLIILDVMMNTLDEGFQFSYKLRKDENTKDIPILMITGVSEATGFKFDPKEDNKDEKYIPVDGYIEKPIQNEEFIKKVNELLQ